MNRLWTGICSRARLGRRSIPSWGIYSKRWARKSCTNRVAPAHPADFERLNLCQASQLFREVLDFSRLLVNLHRENVRCVHRVHILFQFANTLMKARERFAKLFLIQLQLSSL